MLAGLLTVLKIVATIGGAIAAGIATWCARNSSYQPRRLPYYDNPNRGYYAQNQIAYQQQQQYGYGYGYAQTHPTYTQPVQNQPKPNYQVSDNSDINQVVNQIVSMTRSMNPQPPQQPMPMPVPTPTPSGQVMDEWDNSERETMMAKREEEAQKIGNAYPAFVVQNPVQNSAPVMMNSAQEAFLCDPGGYGKRRTQTPVLPQLQTGCYSATAVNAINCHGFDYPREALYDRNVFMQRQQAPALIPPPISMPPMMSPNFENDPFPTPVVMSMPQQPMLDPTRIADAINYDSEQRIKSQRQSFSYGNI
jgi:hypothetical protein